jgi:hypothetical protein
MPQPSGTPKAKMTPQQQQQHKMLPSSSTSSKPSTPASAGQPLTAKGFCLVISHMRLQSDKFKLGFQSPAVQPQPQPHRWTFWTPSLANRPNCWPSANSGPPAPRTLHLWHRRLQAKMAAARGRWKAPAQMGQWEWQYRLLGRGQQWRRRRTRRRKMNTSNWNWPRGRSGSRCNRNQTLQVV